MSKPTDANSFLFFVDLLISAIKALEHGATVTRYACRVPKSDLEVEFEVCIKKVNGKALPRTTHSTKGA